ncbi:tripartite tricarboxylate transporter substrate-binding protein [Xanthobacteraceae bacterium Astr-EGSB]|uniref:tripartite tricarboxylate transporter substrate-binding protein n=1 Tax=Astrobacterium formosum TaxID=3069710 RepID=UPI0027B558C5|nr:tripartite tricarboxylate transporter substrate-binding protein [Xanthobacteraceae bacterium Astr-EGSB]
MRVLMMSAVLLAALGPASAQNYPTKPITVIVPFAAGGPSDTIARLTVAGMGKVLGQQLIIENVGGAGGTIGSARAARAEPDGYTLFIHHLGLATSATLYRKLSYDTKTAFAPIGLVSDAASTFIARPDYGPNTFQEFVAFAKANGDKVSYGHAGVGSASHLCGLLFQTAIQKQITTVPYKGTGPLMNDMLGKQVDITCDQATNTTGPIKSKQVRAYAVTSKARLTSLPELPPAGEAGLPGFEMSVWHGLYAPKGTPQPIIDKLSAALKQALKDTTVASRFADLSTSPATDAQATPEALQKKLLGEIDRWAPIIKAAGVFAD